MTTLRKVHRKTKIHLLLLFLVITAKLHSVQARLHCALLRDKKTLFLHTKTGVVNDTIDFQNSQSVSDDDNDIIEVTARECACSRVAATEYCAVLNGENMCSVHRWNSDPNLETKCYRKTKLENFLQFIYLPSILLLGIVIIMPFSTVAGKNSIEYMFSVCFPCIRRRRLRSMIQMEMQAITEHIAIETIMERDDGMVEQTVLKLRTKSLNLDHQDQGRDSENQNPAPETNHEEEEEKQDEVQSSSPPSDMSSNLDNVEVACLICMAEIKEGERIADISCNHNFHAECIKEWIKRRNACPLCNSQVAESETVLVRNDELNANDEIDEEARNRFERLTAFYRLRTSRRLRSNFA